MSLLGTPRMQVLGWALMPAILKVSLRLAVLRGEGLPPCDEVEVCFFCSRSVEPRLPSSMLSKIAYCMHQHPPGTLCLSVVLGKARSADPAFTKLCLPYQVNGFLKGVLSQVLFWVTRCPVSPCRDLECLKSLLSSFMVLLCWPFSPDCTLDASHVKSETCMLMAKRHIVHTVFLLNIKK